MVVSGIGSDPSTYEFFLFKCWKSQQKHSAVSAVVTIFMACLNMHRLSFASGSTFTRRSNISYSKSVQGALLQFKGWDPRCIKPLILLQSCTKEHCCTGHKIQFSFSTRCMLLCMLTGWQGKLHKTAESTSCKYLTKSVVLAHLKLKQERFSKNSESLLTSLVT